MSSAVLILLILTIYLACVLLIYWLLPPIAVLLDHRLRLSLPAAPERSGQIVRRLGRWLRRSQALDRVLELQRQRLVQSGDERPQALLLHLRAMLCWTAGMAAAALLLRRPAIQGLLAGIMVAAVLNSRVETRIQARRQAVEQSFYKVYRFIDSQVSAGIKPTDVLKGLHESTDDPLVKPLLIRFVGRYSLTLDLDQAVAELRRLHAGKDIETLGTQLRQLLATGTAGRSFQRTEELLFTRYFSLLQKRSEAIRNRLLLSAICMMLPTLLLFLMPMLHQAVSSLGEVFG